MGCAKRPRPLCFPHGNIARMIFSSHEYDVGDGNLAFGGRNANRPSHTGVRAQILPQLSPPTGPVPAAGPGAPHSAVPVTSACSPVIARCHGLRPSRRKSPPSIERKTLNEHSIMNTRISLLSLLLAATGGFLTPTLQASTRGPGAAFPVSQVLRSGETIVRVGDAESSVTYNLGTPARKLGDDVYVFNGFKANLPEARDKGCDTLVITFERNRVVDIKMINPRGVRMLIAASNRGPLDKNRIFVAQR